MFIEDFEDHRQVLVQFSQQPYKKGIVVLTYRDSPKGQPLDVEFHIGIGRSLLAELQHALALAEKRLELRRKEKTLSAAIDDAV